MEMSKENFFEVKYTSVLGQEQTKKKKWTSRLGKFIRKNKLLSITAIIFCLCLSLNFILIFNFIKILENI